MSCSAGASVPNEEAESCTSFKYPSKESHHLEICLSLSEPEI